MRRDAGGLGLRVLCAAFLVAAGGRAPVSAQDAPAALTAEAVVGTWLGELAPGVRLVFTIERGADGALTTVIASPDQGLDRIPTARTRFEGDTLVVDVPGVPGGGMFEGTRSAAGEISGRWHQAGRTIPLVLRRTEAVPRRTRPQEPVPPLPYRTEEVRVEGPGGIVLGGALTLPDGEGPFPAAVLLSGSGAQDRDETIAGHRPFLVLADHLTRAGIAVLRLDDRGVGTSTGDFDTSTPRDFAEDAGAAMAFLRRRPEVDPRSIGLVGHSEGAVVATLVAAGRADVRFVVLMAGLGTTGEEVLTAQGELVLRAAGRDAVEIDRFTERRKRLFDIVRTAPPDQAEARVRARLALDVQEDPSARGASPEAVASLIDAQARMMSSAWYRYLLDFDPEPFLRGVRAPVLAIGGSLDAQVPAADNLRRIEDALRAGGNVDVSVVAFDGLNHLLQTARTGSPAEYARIDETIAPVALETLVQWIRERTAAPPSGGG